MLASRRLPLVLLALSIMLFPVVTEASSREIAHDEQAPPAPARPALRPQRASQPPIIDGVLDDDVWRNQPLETGDFLTYNPLHGEKIKQQTQVWMTYDESFIYFAFQCDDPERSGIKTSITRRDNIWSDDWVGFSLDALGTGQLSYHFMANPSGVQLDMLNSVAGSEDTSPDYVWDSAGRLNQAGYAVEMRVPLQSIRFQGGTNVRMGVLFWRRVSRIGMSVSWPALEPGKWVFEKHASLTFDELKSRLARELIPSATYSRNESRTSPALWGAADDEGDLGLSGKYGLMIPTSAKIASSTCSAASSVSDRATTWAAWSSTPSSQAVTTGLSAPTHHGG